MGPLPFRTSELRPGQIVARDIYDTGTRIPFVRGGLALTDKIIEGLLKHNVRCVFIAQGPLESGPWEPSREERAAEHSAQYIPEITEVCGQLFSTYASAAHSQEEKKQVWLRMHRTLSELIREIRERGIDVAVLLGGVGGPENSLYLRSATVTYLAVLAVLNLHPTEERLAHSVALGALLHDVALADEEFSSGRRSAAEHPDAGVEIMKRMGFDDSIAGLIVRSHHWNIDGSGYPEQPPQDKIAMRAIEPVLGIVRLAVAYEEATAGRGPSERLLPVEALYWLKRMNEQFQSELYSGEKLAGYLQHLAAGPAEAGHRLAAETSQKLRHAKEDFDRRVIRIEEYKRRIFEALPLAYTGSLPIETGPIGERVLVSPEALSTFLRVTPPFGLLDEVELSSGEVGIVVIVNPEQPCLPAVRIARTEDGAEVPSGSMKVKMLSGISNLRGHLRVVRQGGRTVDGCFYSLA